MKLQDRQQAGAAQVGDNPAARLAAAAAAARAVRPSSGMGDGTDAPPDPFSACATQWPPRPAAFGPLLTPVEAAQYLRLDETGAHRPASAIRTLNFWRDKGQLKATKYARRVWYRKAELDRFLVVKTED